MFVSISSFPHCFHDFLNENWILPSLMLASFCRNFQIGIQKLSVQNLLRFEGLNSEIFGAELRISKLLVLKKMKF